MLEINHNPSAISRKVYQSLYQDQLEKEMIAKSFVKNEGNGQGILTKNKSASVFANNGSRMLEGSPVQFRDYHLEKDHKIKDHIENNYDGGSGFFKASQ